MECPTCGKVLELHLNESREQDAKYEELEFHCPDNHNYFARVTEEDLIETD